MELDYTAEAKSGEFIRLSGFRPDGRTPGDYELVLTVRDDTSGQSRNPCEPFTIESTATAAEPTPAPARG